MIYIRDSWFDTMRDRVLQDDIKKSMSIKGSTCSGPYNKERNTVSVQRKSIVRVPTDD